MNFSAALRSLRDKHRPKLMALDIWKYIGPGLLVTVGFIDPGNWASNVAAGSGYGYKLLWMVTLSTVMLIFLQHNAAHLGIATGLCISEAAMRFIKPRYALPMLLTAVVAATATALAEVLGGAIALNMLFGIPLSVGGVLVAVLVAILLFTHSYRRVERIIIALVSIIGLAFVYELHLVDLSWAEAAKGWVVPSIPSGAMPVVMSVLGAVVMPHNLFLHSEIIQSREWNLQDKAVIRRQLSYEFADTLFSMIVGWAINSAMILVAAATFFHVGLPVDALEQAQAMLRPLLGDSAALVFALALLFAGVASSITASMAGGAIFAGIFGEPYNTDDVHTRLGVLVTLVPAVVCILFITNPFKGLIISQILLSVQLPITILLQLRLTGSKQVMGEYANNRRDTVILSAIALIVISLNLLLLRDILL